MSGELSLDTLYSTQSAKEVTINLITAQLEAALAGQTPVDMSAGDVTLTDAELKRLDVVFVSGATAAHILTLSPVKRTFNVVNNNTAALTIKMGTTSVGVSTGGIALLICDGTTNGLLAFTGGGGGGSLATLSDVVLTSPSDGQILTYEASSSKWKNKAPAGGGGANLDPTAAHSYWALKCVDSYSGSSSGRPRVCLAVLQFRATSGGADQCSGGTAISSGDNGTDYASNAFDGDTNSVWSDLNSPPGTFDYIGYHFALPVKVAEVFTGVGFSRPSDGDGLNNGVLMFSDDGSQWYGCNGFTTGVSYANSYTFANTGTDPASPL